MNKKNNKLALNKQIVANLNEHEMNSVKGGYNLTMYDCIFGWLFGEAAHYLVSGDNRGCYSKDAYQGCTEGCSKDCSHTCFSAAKCA